MNWKYYAPYIRSENTFGRCDPTPIFENPKVFHNLIKDMLKPFNKNKFNKIAAIDALGFIIGSVIAYQTKKPLVLIRKAGKLPYSKQFLVSDNFVDYTRMKKSFEMKRDSINKRDKVLLVDEWIETGTQARSAIKLIERLNGKVVGIAALKVHINDNTKILFDKYNCKPIRSSELR